MKTEKLIFTASKVAIAVSLLMTTGSAIAGIANTKHNLSSDPITSTRVSSFSGTAEICVFCHTPHGADTSASVPLWNKPLNTTPASTYTTYDSLGTSTLDGAVETVGSVSIACLSCHDGTQAMSAVINAPGSGLTTTAYSAGTWSGNTSGGVTGGLIPDTIARIGVDLRNDHPIGIQYGGGGLTVAAPTAATKDSDFVAAKNQTLNVTSKVWWVDTESTPNGSRQKTDMQLYTRNFGGTDQPYVECASCHDPHTENTTFLRISNAGSAVCLACHVK